MSAVEVRIGRKTFSQDSRQSYIAISGVSFALDDGEFVCLLGPSGSGKTTTLNIVAGLDTDFEGEVRFSDPQARDSLAYVFQTPRLLPWRTLFENVSLPLKGNPDADSIARSWLRRVGLQEFEHIFPGQASLGMQRRAALARAFATNPTMLLMDEPFVSLDERSAAEVRELLAEIWRTERVLTLFVTHDIDEASQLATRVLVYSKAPAKIVADIPLSAKGNAAGDAPRNAALLRSKIENLVSLS